MAKSNKIVIDHEDTLAILATWWKTLFLTPIWAFLFIMPFGVFVRTFWPAYATTGYVLILTLGLIYFVRDMTKRRLIIDDNIIQFSLTTAPLSELQSIKVGRYHIKMVVNVFAAKSLLLEFKSGQKMELMLNRLKDSDLELLLDVIGRRVSHCKFDPAVEEVIRRRRPISVLRLENPDKLEVQYHSFRLWEELPVVLKKTVHSWARLVGPIGTLVLAMPLWLGSNMQIYNILRNYSDVQSNIGFYNNLVALLKPIQEMSGQGMHAGQELSVGIATSPVVAFIAIVAAIQLAVYALKSVLGANRLSIDSEGIALDRFFYLFSFTAQAAQWKDVDTVMLEQPKGTADPSHARIKFLNKEKHAIMTVNLDCLSARDREKLSLAITRFAGESHVSANLTQALEPSQDKTYTELWLKSLSDTPGRKNLEPLAPGHLLENSRYEIEKKLAVGGEGVAYLGKDLKELARGTLETVVLKETLIPPFVDKQVQQRALERFEREARLLKELKSEYVVGLRDYFIEDHRCYLVLDYVSGNNLRQHIAQHGALDETTVQNLIVQMCEILGFLHGRGVIHRDFTPDNLILQADGKLKLIDFNVARESDEGKTGTIVGKHAYVPPEQFRGKPSVQSDIYAMGATVHFLLTGLDPEPISQSSPAAQVAVSAGMDMLVQKCTVLDAEKRIQSVAEILEMCQAINQPTTIKISLDSEKETSPMRNAN